MNIKNILNDKQKNFIELIGIYLLMISPIAIIAITAECSRRHVRKEFNEIKVGQVWLEDKANPFLPCIKRVVKATNNYYVLYEEIPINSTNGVITSGHWGYFRDKFHLASEEDLRCQN